MRKSFKREHELDRSYDYGEANTKRKISFVKKCSHKRLRQQLKPKKDIDMPRVV